MKLIPYLSFDGNAEEAFNFYMDVFGAESEGITRYDNMPEKNKLPQDYLNKVLHVSLEFDGNALYLCDVPPGMESLKGNNIKVHIDMDSEEQLRELFTKLSAGGEVEMAPEKTFWNAIYTTFTDRYGIDWGLHYELPEE